MDWRTLHTIIKRLNKFYDADTGPGNPFRTLIGVILSHRTTDKISWPATDRLFAKADTPQKISRMKWKQIGKLIYPVNYWPTKAKRILNVCKILVKNHKGKVPKSREELMKLPGVGGKSADIVLAYSMGHPVIAVDSHVKWVSHVLKISREKNPEKVREALHKIVPEKYRLQINDLFVQFGRDICNTGRPKCYKCPVADLCPYEKKNLQPPK